MKDMHLEIVELSLVDLVPYENNANIHSEHQIDQIANSIQEFGFADPIGVWENAEGQIEIVEGHGRALAAQKLGYDKVPVIFLNGLSDEQRRAYTHIHNQLTRNSVFDVDILNEELEKLDFDWESLGFGEVVTDFDEEVEQLSDDYSQNIGEVIYEPKNTNHKIEDLYEYNPERFDAVMKGINDPLLREMLELRKAWFVDFNFSKIADYYAYQATPEEQRAFEAMGLVLLDRDQLIENGFADIQDSLGGGFSG